MSTSNTTIQKISLKLAPPTNSNTASYKQREYAVREVLLGLIYKIFTNLDILDQWFFLAL